jgi:hypothetical protein
MVAVGLALQSRAPRTLTQESVRAGAMSSRDARCPVTALVQGHEEPRPEQRIAVWAAFVGGADHALLIAVAFLVAARASVFWLTEHARSSLARTQFQAGSCCLRSIKLPSDSDARQTVLHKVQRGELHAVQVTTGNRRA